MPKTAFFTKVVICRLFPLESLKRVIDQRSQRVFLSSQSEFFPALSSLSARAESMDILYIWGCPINVVLQALLKISARW